MPHQSNHTTGTARASIRFSFSVILAAAGARMLTGNITKFNNALAWTWRSGLARTKIKPPVSRRAVGAFGAVDTQTWM
jgi:hypothetical protein